MTRIDRRALFASGAAAALLAASGLSVGASPRAGGSLRLAVPRDGSLARIATGAMFDTLTEVAPDGTLKGELATSWQGSADARLWSFRLQDAVRFHDGTELKPRHVVSALRGSELPGLLRVEVAGRHRIELELDGGNPDLQSRGPLQGRSRRLGRQNRDHRHTRRCCARRGATGWFCRYRRFAAV